MCLLYPDAVHVVAHLCLLYLDAVHVAAPLLHIDMPISVVSDDGS